MHRLSRWYVYVPVSAALLALVVWRARPLDALMGPPRVDAVLLLAAVALNPILILLWADRSASLMAGVGRPIGRLALLPVVTFANTISNLTPASSGEAMRAYVLKNRHGVPLRRSTPVILMERIYALYLMGVSASGLALIEVVQKPVYVAAGFAILLTLVFLPNLAYEFLGFRPLASVGRVARRLVRRPATERLAAILIEVDEHLDGLMTHPRRALGFVVRTLLIFAVFSVQLSVVLTALGTPVAPWTAWGAYGLAMVAGIASTLPFGLGATDSVLAVLLASWGVPVGVAGLAALTLRVVQTLPLGILGTLSYVYLSRGLTHRRGAFARPRQVEERPPGSDAAASSPGPRG